MVLDSLSFEGRRELIETLGIRREIDQEEDVKGQMIQVIYIYLYTHRFRRTLTENHSSTRTPPVCQYLVPPSDNAVEHLPPRVCTRVKAPPERPRSPGVER